MTQSIITRYHGATNTKPSRMSACTSSGSKRVFQPYEYSFTNETNHRENALGLAKKLGWCGHWQGGALNDKGDMVWVNTSDGFADLYCFEVQQ
jgi:hypothetical protein